MHIFLWNVLLYCKCRELGSILVVFTFNFYSEIARKVTFCQKWTLKTKKIFPHAIKYI